MTYDQDAMRFLFDELMAAFPRLLYRPPLSAPDFVDYPMYCREMFRQEERHRAATDALARQWIATNALPDAIANWPRYFLFLRAEAAVDNLARASVETPTGHRLLTLYRQVSRELAYETLLITSWHVYTRDHWLKAVTVSAYFDMPLYGVVPAAD